jgi:hypothetical protein
MCNVNGKILIPTVMCVCVYIHITLYIYKAFSVRLSFRVIRYTVKYTE